MAFLVRLVERIIFKKYCPKRTLPSDFVKLGSEILYLFLAEKMVVRFVLFCLLQICLILAYFFNWSTHRAEKDAYKENKNMRPLLPGI